jgi:hypothetical protein
MLREQWPDWRRAGPRRLGVVVRSAVRVRIETLLPVPAELTVVHAERDLITGHSYRIGAGEGIDPQRLGEVDLAGVATWLTEGLPKRRYQRR